MAKDVAVAIEGLSDFRRALKAVSPELPKMLHQELKQAAESAAARARRRYAQNFGAGSGRRKTVTVGAGGRRSVRTRKGTAASIRAVATQTGSGVAFGGARFPWVAGQEFGSLRYRQFFPYTGMGPGGRGSWGRVIFPAVRDEVADTEADLRTRFDALARKAYPEQP